MTGTEELPRGTRLGVDVGDVRVGLARSDLDGLIATPIETLRRETAVQDIISWANSEDARAIMVGLPRGLDGREGAAAAKARAFAQELVTALHTAGSEATVHLVDERLTTVSAHRAMHASGRKGRKHRQVVDQVAAVMILQDALEIERRTGARAGEQVSPTDAPAPGREEDQHGA